MGLKHDSGTTVRRVWRRSDGILILSLLLVALFIGIRYIWPPEGGQVCYVLYDRETVMKVSLDKNRTFSIAQLPQVVFEVRDGRIAFIQSDCPDQVCVHTGYIGHFGQFAACLPNHVALRVDGEQDSNTPDTVA